MKKYKVKTKFVFEGEFIVTANNREEAQDNVVKHCGLVIGGDIHSTLMDEDIDWEFPVHPDKIVYKPKRIN